MRRGVALCELDRQQLVLDDAEEAGAGAQDIEIIGDLGGVLFQSLADFLAPERGEALQAQFENAARLRLGEPAGAVLGERNGADRR